MMTQAQWHLRPAHEADAPDLQRIDAACFDVPWSLDLMRQALSAPKYLVLCLESLAPSSTDSLPAERLLGYVAAWSVFDEGQIDRLAVLPALRRRGLGRVLLRGVLESLAQAGAARVFLEVRPSNLSAVELYQGAGFVRAGQRKGYYEDGEDAIVLGVEL